MTKQFCFKFWGTRGSYPVPGNQTSRFGGNTPCVEVRIGDRLIILDAGTGLIHLGATLLPKEFDVLLSHTHIDHIVGIPFFQPALNAGNHIHIWAGHLENPWDVKKVVSHLMTPPLFPLTVDDFKAKTVFHDFKAGEELSDSRFLKNKIRITTHLLNHPDRATAYRITYNNQSLCYVTDVEHSVNALDEDLVGFLKDADWLIYDSTYDDREFSKHIGWGHSTWQQAVSLCKAAGVKNLAVFHHDPMAIDDILEKRSVELKDQFPSGIIAREGLTITI
jgi:phosphoribosyl 1,2-cyclic phosphodiesterase